MYGLCTIGLPIPDNIGGDSIIHNPIKIKKIMPMPIKNMENDLKKNSGKKMDFLSTHSNSDVEDDDDKADLFSPPSNSAKKQGSSNLTYSF